MNDFRTKITATRAFYSAGITFFIAVALGAQLTTWLGHDVVYYLGMGGVFTLSLLQWKLRDKLLDRDAIQARRAQYLDALRFRALQNGEEFPVIEEVKRLRDEGRKIEAIKLYRQLHPSTDLRAALDAVDLM